MKTTKIRKFAAGVLVATLIAAVPVTGAFAAHRNEADVAIAAAKAAHEAAVAAGKDSANSAALIKQAEDLLPSKQYTKAIELANKAIKQDEFAASQGADDGADPGVQAAAQKAIADAEAAREKASSVGGEWRDTGKMIKEAEGLMNSGEYEKAIKLANKAMRQGQLGYDQAIAEKDAGFPSYVKFKQ